MRGRGLLVGCVIGAVSTDAVGVAYAEIRDSKGVVTALIGSIATSSGAPPQQRV